MFPGPPALSAVGLSFSCGVPAARRWIGALAALVPLGVLRRIPQVCLPKALRYSGGLFLRRAILSARIRAMCSGVPGSPARYSA